jgi:hypothetical protein
VRWERNKRIQKAMNKMKKDAELLSELLERTGPVEIEEQREQPRSIDIDLGEAPKRKENVRQRGQIEMPQAQMPQAFSTNIHPQMRLHHSAPRDIVAGVPIVMMGTEHRLGTDISLKRKRGGRGKDKAEAGRPRKKCKMCGQLGMSEKEQQEMVSKQ